MNVLELLQRKCSSLIARLARRPKSATRDTVTSDTDTKLTRSWSCKKASSRQGTPASARSSPAGPGPEVGCYSRDRGRCCQAGSDLRGRCLMEQAGKRRAWRAESESESGTVSRRSLSGHRGTTSPTGLLSFRVICELDRDGRFRTSAQDDRDRDRAPCAASTVSHLHVHASGCISKVEAKSGPACGERD